MPPASVGFSKSGGMMNVISPVPALILKNDLIALQNVYCQVKNQYFGKF